MERGTSAVALSDIAEAADVSRKVVYQPFGDRDTQLLEAVWISPDGSCCRDSRTARRG
ncbi:TetR family transcriptional regulator [Streptomyces sp. NPDC020802]|uniref:TetR family transcriptional regulator n=1 Tax=Streptomyces sp. NPDC020802 TaxID=3365094 RepID=UPI0037A4D283